MRREICRPKAVSEGPLISPGWAYGTVFREKSGLLRLWYLSLPIYSEHYAESEDGLTWRTPRLNIVPEVFGAGANAFLSKHQKDSNGRWLVGLHGPEGFSVLDAEQQPHSAARSRFTALYLAYFGEEFDPPGGRGLCLAYSEDGIHWRAEEENPVISGWMDTNNCLTFDPVSNKYVIYGRPPVHVQLGTHANRLLSRMESNDLIHWSSPQTILDTDERDADPLQMLDEGKLRGDNQTRIRGKNRQFYGITVFRSSGLYLGFAQLFDLPTGQIWLELVHSRDSINWIREPLRQAYIPNRQNSWEAGQVRPALAPVPMKEDLWIYYSASPHSHHEGSASGAGMLSIGCRSTKRHRWVHYRSEETEGELLTHPVENGNALFVNGKTDSDGWIRVEATTPEGEPVKGRELDRCKPIQGDHLDLPVAWSDTGHSTAIPSRIRLRFRTYKASLFAFRIDS